LDYYLYPIKNDNLELLKYLNSKVSNVDYNNILLNAIHYNKINIVSYALDNGADISYLKNELKDMILMDQYEMIKYALDNGAEINKYMINISRSENVKNLLKKYYDKQND
jgi:RNA binding exosome subunit